jgi:hypothetical protein
MKITSYQYILATGWLPVCWQWIWAICAVCLAISISKASLDSMTAWENVFSLSLVVVLSFLIGWFAAVIPGWFVFGPLLYSQGIENGGPFVPGDTVRIIAGKYRDTVARVYGKGQHDTVRVELGKTEREQYADYFSAHELVRENRSEQKAEPALPNTEV